MTTDPLLHIEGVHAAYGDTVALHDVSVDIADNEFFALLGPSGCGKTTLLRCIAGFETPQAGRIELDGRDLVGMAAHRRPVNMMFQSYALFPHLSVEKNIGYGLEADRVDRAEARRRVREVMEVVGLEDLAKRRPAQLSGGQRQRVALARAIVKRPRLLLLDEPLSALDRQVRASMQLELKRLQHEVGLTFVVVTHDQEEAMSMADRIAVLRDGRLEQLATPQELYASPASRFVAGFIGSANLLDGFAVRGGVDVPQLGVIESSGRVAAGEPATVVVRPEDVDLSPDAAAPGLRGTVVDMYFLGGMSTVSVQLASTGTLVLASVHGTTDLRRGDEVTVRLGRATAVARDESSSAQPEQLSGEPAAQEVSA